MNSIILCILIIILLFLLIRKKENFNFFDSVLDQNFNIQDLDDVNSYNILTNEIRDDLIPVSNESINMYKEYSLNFRQIVNVDEKYFNQGINYTQDEVTNILSKLKITLIGDMVNFLFKEFSYQSKITDNFLNSFQIQKKYLSVHENSFVDDNIFIIMNDNNLPYNLNIEPNQQFENYRRRRNLIDKLNIFRNEISFINQEFRQINKIQGIFFDPFKLNFGIILLENDLSNDKNIDLEFKLHVFNKNIEISGINYNLDTQYLRNEILIHTHFTYNKNMIPFFLTDNYKTQRRQLENMGEGISQGEFYHRALNILSEIFSSDTELNSNFIGRLSEPNIPFLDYMNTKINLNNQVNGMKFRNLLVYDSFLKDFEIHLLRISSREDFTNMCTDLKLPGNVTYTDNEIFGGYTCNNYKENNLCGNNRTLPGYEDYNLNILNLNAKEACCVCGGGNRDASTYSNSNTQQLTRGINNRENNSGVNYNTEFNGMRDYDGIVQYKTKGVSSIFVPNVGFNF